VAGANFGLSLLWILLLTTFALAITQEIGARMGLVPEKDLASIIREKSWHPLDNFCYGRAFSFLILGILLRSFARSLPQPWEYFMFQNSSPYQTAIIVRFSIGYQEYILKKDWKNFSW